MPSERVLDPGDSMSEPEFTPRKAVEYLESVAGYEAALRRRTEGITWMIWGIVTPGIFLSYALAAALLPSPWPAWANLIFAPWVLVGSLTTGALWRSASLVLSRPVEGGVRGGLLHIGVWLTFMIVGWTVALELVPTLATPLYPLLLVGTIMILWGATPLGRLMAIPLAVPRAATLMGALVFAGGLALALLGVGNEVASVASATLVATTYLAGGFYVTMRG